MALVISLAAAHTSQMSIDGSQMTVGAGAKLSHAVIKAVGAGLGWAGAFGGNSRNGGWSRRWATHSAADVTSVRSSTVSRCWKKTAPLRTLSQEEVGFSHRKTSLVGLTVLEVTFELEPRDVIGIDQTDAKAVDQSQCVAAERGTANRDAICRSGWNASQTS